MSGLIGDHINFDTLDNRRHNLRAITRSEDVKSRNKAGRVDYAEITKKSWETRRKRGKVSESAKRTWATRQELYGPSGGNEMSGGNTESAKRGWKTRRKLYGPSGQGKKK